MPSETFTAHEAYVRSPVPPAGLPELVPPADLQLLIARGRQGFLDTIASHEADAARWLDEARSDRYLASHYEEGSEDRRVLLAAAETYEANARLCRARADANRVTFERVEAALAARKAA